MADKWIQLMSEDGTDNLFPTSRMELLWTNSAPTSAFAQQTVSLDLSEYMYIVIEMDQDTNLSRGRYYFGTVGFVISMSLVPTSITNAYTRTATISASGINFTVGYVGSSSNNNAMIPYHIYGIK